MTMDVYAANVVTGPGAVIRWQAGILLAGGPDQTAALDLIAEFQSRLGTEPASGAIIELLRSRPQFDTTQIDLAAAVTTPQGVRVFVRGGAQVRTEADELIKGPETERDLFSVDALWLGLVDPPTVQGHPAMDMRRGVVSGGGVVLYRPHGPQPVGDPPLRSASPTPLPRSAPVSSPTPLPRSAPGTPAPAPLAPMSWPPPVQSPATAEPIGQFEAIDWDHPSEVETREPLAVLTPGAVDEAEAEASVSTEDQVLGIRCSRSHFNNPKAGYCQVCGISMVHLTHRLELGPRPTLGFVVFADGATYAVDRPYLIGRSPRPAADGELTPLATQDATQSVSREHAELQLDGWDTKYIDLGSTNGSFLWNSDGNRWDPLPANVPTILSSGATVSVGRMTFVFQAASRAVGQA